MKYRAAFDDEAVKYVNEHYPAGATTVYGKRKGNQYQVSNILSSHEPSHSLPFLCFVANFYEGHCLHFLLQIQP
jgi:hypothetical protein